MSTMPQDDQNVGPEAIVAGRLPRLAVGLFAFSIVIAIAQFVGFVAFVTGLLTDGKTTPYVDATVLSPAYWAFISVAIVACIIGAHFYSPRIRKLGLAGRGLVMVTLTISYLNLAYVLACIAFFAFVFWSIGIAISMGD